MSVRHWRMAITIKQAGVADVNHLVPLFDAYRVFYQQPSDPDGARAFLQARLSANEATVFLAFPDDAAEPVGFTLLYQTYSNVAMKPVVVLNDLYTRPEARGRGVGRALIREAATFARAQGATTLRLVTAADNHAAKRLYDQAGFVREAVFETYNLKL